MGKYVVDIPEIVYDDIVGIHNYIAQDNLSAAKNTVAKIVDAIDGLRENPLVGFELQNKFCIDSNLRGKIIKPYIVFYSVEDYLIKIYRVLDGRSDYLVTLGL